MKKLTTRQKKAYKIRRIRNISSQMGKYFDIKEDIIFNNLGNKQTKTLEKMKKQLKMGTKESITNAFMKVSPNITRRVKTEMRKDIKAFARNEGLLYREAREIYKYSNKDISNLFKKAEKYEEEYGSEFIEPENDEKLSKFIKELKSEGITNKKGLFNAAWQWTKQENIKRIKRGESPIAHIRDDLYNPYTKEMDEFFERVKTKSK